MMRQIDSSLGEAGETKNPAVRALIAAGLSQGNPGGAGSQ
ncbi:IS6 family transposase, partial [Brucella melitensis]